MCSSRSSSSSSSICVDSIFILTFHFWFSDFSFDLILIWVLFFADTGSMRYEQTSFFFRVMLINMAASHLIASITFSKGVATHQNYESTFESKVQSEVESEIFAGGRDFCRRPRFSPKAWSISLRLPTFFFDLGGSGERSPPVKTFLLRGCLGSEPPI